MPRNAFRMQLLKGTEAEYIRMHDEIWPELQELLRSYGVSDYAIFLDEATGSLFGSMQVEDLERYQGIRNEPVMQKWWKAMASLMEIGPDGAPVAIPMKEVFYLA